MGRTALGLLLVFALAATMATAQELWSASPVDVELVIAVDVSASMDREEFRVQRQGFVEAIRHPEFVRAISNLPRQRIALTYIEWSSSTLQKVVVPFSEIDGQDSAEAFAAALEASPIKRGQGTSISGAIEFGANLLSWNRFEGDRRVIDISGDGFNLSGPPVVVARDRAVARGVVINGLPIIVRPSRGPPDLEQYYADCVIGGPGSFMLPVRETEEFAEAVRQKLIREVAGLPQATIAPVSATTPVDCLIGEKTIASIKSRMFRDRGATRDSLERWYRLRREMRGMPARDPDRWY